MKYPSDVLAQIRSHLLSEKNKLNLRLDSLRLQDPYSDPDRLIDNAASDTDAKEESSHERMEALEKELKLRLEDIDQSLARVEKGTYGQCLTCGDLIDTDRLAINPTAIYCISCLTKKGK